MERVQLERRARHRGGDHGRCREHAVPDPGDLDDQRIERHRADATLDRRDQRLGAING
jgi:hypothetical protein